MYRPLQKISRFNYFNNQSYFQEFVVVCSCDVDVTLRYTDKKANICWLMFFLSNSSWYSSSLSFESDSAFFRLFMILLKHLSR